MNNQPVAWWTGKYEDEGEDFMFPNTRQAHIDHPQSETHIFFPIPLYTQDQLEKARKLGMQQERAMWNLSTSTQEIMDTHPVKAQNKPVAYKAWHEDLGWTYHDWKDGFTAEGVIPLYTHPAPTKVKFASDSCESGWIYLENTHPVKEHFEDEPQAEELHEIMQSNNHPVKELFKDAENRDELIGQEFETYLEKLTQDFKEGFKEGVLFCEDVARRPALYGQDTHSVKELTDEEIIYFYKPCFYHEEDFVSEIRAILRKAKE